MKKVPPRHGLSKQEISLWEKVARTIRAYEGKKVESVAEEGTQPTPKKKSMRPVAERTYTPPPVRKKPTVLPPLSVGDIAAIDGASARKFSSGKMKVSATLDLHGMRQDEAAEAVYHFILMAYEAQKRCVRIVTGKGARSETRTGVLQRQVPHWLNLPQLRPCILAMVYATQKDGGTGALYVMIKRARPEA